VPTKLSNRNYELVVFGATGFTGRLVAEVVNTAYGHDHALRWALAGRNLQRLAEVRDAIGAPADLPLLQADAADEQALQALVASTALVLTTVGPYQRHGGPLVQACARAGTDYVDLCGEPAWMAAMIPQLEPWAAASGARIVFSCGFDSIPFDLGVVFAQAQARARHGAPLQRIRARVAVMKGAASGGTIASLLATVEHMRRDPGVARTMANPFALTPGFQGPRQPSGQGAVYDERAQAWTAPFVMAPINTKNVHRTNALRGHVYGQDFVYDERMLAGEGAKGEARARRLARTANLQNLLLAFGPTRGLLRRFVLPKPGQGPDQRAREAGRYEVLFLGDTADGRALDVRVTGDRDPGYGSTAKMIVQSALCLLQDINHDMTKGGVWTPGAAMGLALVRRLQDHAGLTFELL
jgi:short subunit dehydrogenase-like uncharacterized protein